MNYQVTIPGSPKPKRRKVSAVSVDTALRNVVESLISRDGISSDEYVSLFIKTKNSLRIKEVGS